MNQVSTDVIYIYLTMFVSQFGTGNTYYWVSTLKNAEEIFFYFQKEKNFENILFNYELEKDLNFLTQDVLDMWDNLEGRDYHGKLLSLLNNDKETKILTNFKKHPISTWQFDEILFSSGVYCCLHQLQFPKQPSLNYFSGICNFLLENRLSFQFYFFLKEYRVFLYNKKAAVLGVKYHLSSITDTYNFNILKFLDNFLLIWDLLKYDTSEYLELKAEIIEQVKLKPEIFAPGPYDLKKGIIKRKEIYSYLKLIENKL